MVYILKISGYFFHIRHFINLAKYQCILTPGETMKKYALFIILSGVCGSLFAPPSEKSEKKGLPKPDLVALAKPINKATKKTQARRRNQRIRQRANELQVGGLANLEQALRLAERNQRTTTEPVENLDLIRRTRRSINEEQMRRRTATIRPLRAPRHLASFFPRFAPRVGLGGAGVASH